MPPLINSSRKAWLSLPITMPVPGVPPPPRSPVMVPVKPSAWNAATADADEPAASVKSFAVPEFSVMAPVGEMLEEGEAAPVRPSIVVSKPPTVAVARSIKVVPATGAGAAPV